MRHLSTYKLHRDVGFHSLAFEVRYLTLFWSDCPLVGSFTLLAAGDKCITFPAGVLDESAKSILKLLSAEVQEAVLSHLEPRSSTSFTEDASNSDT